MTDLKFLEHQTLEIPKLDHEDPKDIYAFFGLIYYYMNVFEVDLHSFYTLLYIKKYIHTKPDKIMIMKLEKNLNEKLNSFEKQTLGQIIKQIKNIVNDLVFSEFEKIFLLQEEVNKKRCYLAHEFFFKYDYALCTSNGRKIMLNDLTEIFIFIDKALKENNKIILKICNELKIKEYIYKKVHDDLSSVGIKLLK